MRLEKECLMDWVEQMAESLVYEIVEQMSGIVLRRSEPWERLSEGHGDRHDHRACFR